MEGRFIHPRSEGNLALASITHWSQTLTRHRASRDTSAIDPVGPARGVVVGAGLSVMLWCFIILVSFGFMTVIHPS